MLMSMSVAHCVTPALNATWLNTSNFNLVLSLVPKEIGNEINQILSTFKNINVIMDEMRQKLASQNLVDGGLFLMDRKDMTNQLLKIDGMSLTSSSTQIKPFQGTPSEINLSFFEYLLSCSTSELKFINPFLMRYMRNIQFSAKECEENKSVGILLGLIDYDSLNQKTLTTFTYVAVTTTTKEKFEQINCQDQTPLPEYPYQFDVARFSYS